MLSQTGLSLILNESFHCLPSLTHILQAYSMLHHFCASNEIRKREIVKSEHKLSATKSFSFFVISFGLNVLSVLLSWWTVTRSVVTFSHFLICSKCHFVFSTPAWNTLVNGNKSCTGYEYWLDTRLKCIREHCVCPIRSYHGWKYLMVNMLSGLKSLEWAKRG